VQPTNSNDPDRQTGRKWLIWQRTPEFLNIDCRSNDANELLLDPNVYKRKRYCITNRMHAITAVQHFAERFDSFRMQYGTDEFTCSSTRHNDPRVWVKQLKRVCQAQRNAAERDVNNIRSGCK
jgi:hypothetical protein